MRARKCRTVSTALGAFSSDLRGLLQHDSARKSRKVSPSFRSTFRKSIRLGLRRLLALRDWNSFLSLSRGLKRQRSRVDDRQPVASLQIYLAKQQCFAAL
jgi:hypothetical protein